MGSWLFRNGWQPEDSRTKLKGYFIYTIAVVSVGSGFQHGYHTGVINVPQSVINATWVQPLLKRPKDYELMWGLVVAMFSAGGLVGGALTGLFANHFGRQRSLLFNNIIAIVAGVLFAVTKILNTLIVLCFARFIIGINAGLNAGLAPVFLNEISPTKIRGAMGTLYQLNITISILLSMGFGHKNAFGTKDLWPYLFALVAPVALIQLICLIFCPESPKYFLERKDDEEKCKNALEKLIGPEYEEQFNELKSDIEGAKQMPKVTVKDMLVTKKLRKPLIIICVLMAAQQLSGINAVIYYSTDIFSTANLGDSATEQLASIILCVVNVLTTIASVYLVEKCGRKFLLLLSHGGMVLALIGICVALYFAKNNKAAGWSVIVLVFIYVIFFAVGAGAIPWLLGPELFNTAARPIAVSIAVPTNWLFNIVVGLLFPLLQNLMGFAVFSVFVTFNIATFVFVWILAPETKNKTIEEITAGFE